MSAAGTVDLVVRPIEPDQPGDVAAAAAVLVAARAAAATAELMPLSVHPPADVYRWFAEQVVPRREVWVAESGSGLVGVLVLDAAFVDQLHVTPGHWGRGIGTTMLQLAMSLRPAGFELWVFAANGRARGLYERHGLRPVAHGDGAGNEEGAPDVRYAWWPGAGAGVGGSRHPGEK